MLISPFSCSAKWPSVDGILYKPQGAVILDVVNDYPVFVYINALYIVDCEVFLNVQVMSTISFSEHYFIYHKIYRCLQICISETVILSICHLHSPFDY